MALQWVGDRRLQRRGGIAGDAFLPQRHDSTMLGGTGRDAVHLIGLLRIEYLHWRPAGGMGKRKCAMAVLEDMLDPVM